MNIIYKGFVALIVVSLISVLYHVDQKYKTTEHVLTDSEVAQVVKEQADESPIAQRAETPPKESLTALHFLDKFSEATVVDSIESIEEDGSVWVKKDVLLSNMKYPLIRREIRYEKHPDTHVWVPVEGQAYVADQVLLGLKDDHGLDSIQEVLDDVDAEVIRSFAGGSNFLIRFKEKEVESVEEVMKELQAYGHIDYVEPNYLKVPTYLPNDPRVSEIWSFNNTGQHGGLIDADIDLFEAWDITRGSPSVVVAVIDTGLDLSHPEFQNALFQNTAEVINGIDDDRNGYVDDVSGWNFAASGSGDNNPQDIADSHGTHVSGTIAARGDNNQGVVGVAPNISLLPIKVLDEEGGYLSDFISGIDYATEMGASIINISLGGSGYSRSEELAINRTEAAGVLVVVASGNDGVDLELNPDYPSSYPNPNILVTLGTNRFDRNGSYSNVGSTVVDVGAPGTQILSTYVGGGYQYFSGTSMAAPHVAGVAALLKSVSPASPATVIKEVIMQTVDPLPSLAGQCVSGGRINAKKAIDLMVQGQFYPHGSQITIKSIANSRYVRPDPNNGNRLIADGAELNRETIFFSYQQAARKYGFRSLSNHRFVTSTPTASDSLMATQNGITDWELFTPVGMGGTQFALQANANKGYVSAENGGASPLIANRTSVNGWEIFVIEPVRPLVPGTRIIFQSIANDRYISVDDNGFVIATDAEADDDNVFDVELTSDGYIALRSALTGNYVSANDAGNAPLRANQTFIGEPEKFLAFYHETGQFTLRSKSNYLLISSNNGSSNQLVANRQGLSPWEVYRARILEQ